MTAAYVYCKVTGCADCTAWDSNPLPYGDQVRFPRCAIHTTVLTCLLFGDFTYMNNEEGRARAEKKRTIGIRTATITTTAVRTLLSTRLRLELRFRNRSYLY